MDLGVFGFQGWAVAGSLAALAQIGAAEELNACAFGNEFENLHSQV